MLFTRAALLLAAAAAISAQNTIQGLLDFYATQNNLQYMANLFAAVNYGFYPQANLPQLQSIANHIKNCSDAFDLATIAVTELIPQGAYFPLIDASEQDTINQRFVPSTQGTITSHLHTLLYEKAFYEDVQANPAMKIKLCHWVGDLAYQNAIFLGIMARAAPTYTTSWTNLRTAAASVYNDFLGNLNGFSCGGL
ncbi:unnamed protein product [Mycena citricolor]|uniref:Uncharacterized protein n=1 Tax=Mycena citricolor TaxID=2018698 RepID=A0AAD2H946_9AGAR|nr:unnamed protein product [Mycena citricolor]